MNTTQQVVSDEEIARRAYELFLARDASTGGIWTTGSRPSGNCSTRLAPGVPFTLSRSWLESSAREF